MILKTEVPQLGMRASIDHSCYLEEGPLILSPLKSTSEVNNALQVGCGKARDLEAPREFRDCLLQVSANKQSQTLS